MFDKIPRLESEKYRITEKIDGTRGIIFVPDVVHTFDDIVIQSRCGRRLSLTADNHGFYNWCKYNGDAIITLPSGLYYGEFFGLGIQRTYGLPERRFMVFYAPTAFTPIPEFPIQYVPLIFEGPLPVGPGSANYFARELFIAGSRAVPGFMRPEGVVVHALTNDARWKIYCEEKENKYHKSGAPAETKRTCMPKWQYDALDH